MKLKSIAVAAALLPVFGSAFADDFNVNLIGGPNVFSSHIGATHTAGDFTDTFTFRVNDGAADSAVASVTITVLAVNDAPVAATATDPYDCTSA